MTQPTGDHASGIKLASAYVDVDARTRNGMKSVHDELTGVEQHAKQVGDNSAASIVDSMTAGGSRAAQGWGDRFRSVVQAHTHLTAEQSAMSYGQTFKDALRNTRLADDADFLFHGFNEKANLYGTQAANTFHGRLIQMFAANRMDAAQAAESTGQALAQGLERGVAAAGEGLGMGEAFKKASEGLGKLGGKFGEAGEAAGGLGEKLGGIAAPLAMLADPAVIGVAGVLALAGGVGEVINKVNELGERWEDLGHKLEIQTGATGERLEGLKGQVSAVYGQVTNSMDEVGSVVSVVNTAFRDSGSGATAVATQLEHLQSMIGAVDTQDLGNAFRAFRIGGDAAAQSSVIDQLLKESQATQVPVNSLIEAMTRASPIANEFHLSISDTLATMGQFSQAGIDPSRTIFALSRAAKEAADHGRDFKSVLQEDINAIKNAPNEQAAEAAATKAFGPTSGRGGAAMIVQAVQSGQFNLDPAFLAQLERADGLVNKTWHDTLTWKESWTLFGHDVSVALQPVSEALHQKVQNAMAAVVGFLSSHKTEITGFVTGIVNGVEKGISGVGKVIDYLRPAFQEIKPQIEDLMHAFGPMAMSIGRDILPVVEALGKAFLFTLKTAIENAGPTLEFFASLFKDIKGVADYVHDHFGPAMKENSKELHDDFEGVKNIVHDVGVVFHDVFNPVLDVIKQIVSALDSGMDTLNHWKDALNNIHMPHLELPHIPGFQFGGVVRGQDGLALPGFGGGDIIPALLEPGEHVMTKDEVKAGGGHGNIALLRALIRAGIMPDILGSMTGLGVAAVGAGYQTGGPVGPPGTPGAYTQTLARLDQITRSLADTFTRTKKGIDGFTESMDTLKKGDLPGTVDKLSQAVDDLRPAVNGLRTGAEAIEHGADAMVRSIPDSVPSLSRPSLSRPSLSGLRDRLRGRDYMGAYDRTRDLGERIDQITTDTGIYTDRIPGLDIGGHVGDLFHHGADLREHLRNRNAGGVTQTVDAAAGTVNALAKATGFDVSSITKPIQDIAQEAGTAAVTVEGLGAALGAVLPEAGAALGSMAGPAAIAAGSYLFARPGGVADQWATPRAIAAARQAAVSDSPFNVLSPGRQAAINAQQAQPQRVEDIPNPLLGPTATPGYSQRPGSLNPFDALQPPAGSIPTRNVPGMAEATIGAGVGKKPPVPNLLGGIDLPGSQFGGPINGHGPRGRDSTLIMAAPGEHMLPVDEVDKAGGHSGIYLLRALIRAGMLQGLAGGGPVSGVSAIDSFVSSMQGTPYSQGARNDCSGLASQICNVALGLPPRSSMFTTRNEGEWLAAHGFKMGAGPPGTLRVGWYNNGSDPNDGHTAVTLPDGRPAESGGSHGNFIAGAGAAGAEASEFDHHAYLPANPEGPTVGSATSGAQSAAAAVSAATGGGGTGGGAPADTGGAGGGTDYLGTFGDMIAGGLKENMLPGFSDPTSWGGVKSAAAFFKFLATANGQPGSPLAALAAARGTSGAAGLNLFGDLLSGSGGASAHDFADLIGAGGGGGGLAGIVAPKDGDITPQNTGGPDMVVNRNVTYTGPIQPNTHQADEAMAARQVKQTLNSQRLVPQ